MVGSTLSCGSMDKRQVVGQWTATLPACHQIFRSACIRYRQVDAKVRINGHMAAFVNRSADFIRCR